ncbi:MAG TPA: RNA ligase family protein [Gemmatimonadales bacterium]|jgi:bifunctional non-homologous end joining protein LigD|nr:RNA ligase family protein [Gemmatimonadales bacterium]
MSRQAHTALPRVAPILVSLRDQPFSSPQWLFEPKYDGFRGVFYLTRHGCAMFSRRGNHFRRFEELCRRIAAELPRREAILDGEVVSVNKEGRVDFYGLMRGEGHLAYAVFDVLWLNGRDLRPLPLRNRKKRLERLVSGTGDTLVRVPSFEEHGRELFRAACQLDLEGIVAKRTSDPYATETSWYKIKNPAYTQAEGRGELFERRI